MLLPRSTLVKRKSCKFCPVRPNSLLRAARPMARMEPGFATRIHLQKYIELPRIHGSLTPMKRSCAHRWNARGRSWTGPSQAFTSTQAARLAGPAGRAAALHRMACHKIAAKKRKKRINARLFALFAFFRGYFPFPEWSLSHGLLMMTLNRKNARRQAALRMDFTREGCHCPKNTELTSPPGLGNRTEPESIGVNRSESE